MTWRAALSKLSHCELGVQESGPKHCNSTSKSTCHEQTTGKAVGKNQPHTITA